MYTHTQNSPSPSPRADICDLWSVCVYVYRESTSLFNSTLTICYYVTSVWYKFVWLLPTEDEEKNERGQAHTILAVVFADAIAAVAVLVVSILWNFTLLIL